MESLGREDSRIGSYAIFGYRIVFQGSLSSLCPDRRPRLFFCFSAGGGDAPLFGSYGFFD